MPNNKKKSLSNIKSADVIHPYSRKAMQLKRVAQVTIYDRHTVKSLEKNQTLERLLYFKEHLNSIFDENSIKDGKCALSNSQVHDLIKLYIDRNQEAIISFKLSLRKNRPLPSKMQLLQSIQTRELLEYENGSFVMPLLTCWKNVAILYNWDQDWNSLSKIKMTNVSAKDSKI